jgi:hypothetical protein
MTQPLAIDEADRYLKAMLVRAGVDLAAPDLATTWRVFQEFVDVPVDTASDMVLFQTGVYHFYGPDQFILDFLRQFEVEDDEGEHGYFEQLHCESLYEPVPELRALGEFNRWDEEDDSRSAFFRGIEARQEFVVPAAFTPVEVRIAQQAV